MARVVLEGVSKVFRCTNGQLVVALREASLTVAAGEFLVLVGPSGSGKTTLLRLIAGLESPTSGSIRFDGQDVRHAAPRDRDVGMVFQHHALYPHQTVRENLAFGLRLRGLPPVEIERRVRAAAETLDLDLLLDRLPRDLSGGQRQRVAVGRALAREPQVVLFDEPLSNLDAGTRGQLRDEILRLHRQLGATMVYVTHDQDEAMLMGDRIAVMIDGVIQQIADPRSLYRSPANVFVAGFVGSPPMNLFRGRVESRPGHWRFRGGAGETTSGDLEWHLPTPPPGFVGRLGNFEVVLGLRPEQVRATGQADNDLLVPVSTVVRLAQPTGPDTFLHLVAGTTPFVARVGPDVHPTPGTPLKVHFNLAQAHWFEAGTGNAIG